MKLDVSLEDDDEIVVTIDMSSIEAAQAEMKRALSRCESQIARKVSSGVTDTQQYGDLLKRRKKLSDSLAELANVEAKVRLREKE